MKLENKFVHNQSSIKKQLVNIKKCKQKRK